MRSELDLTNYHLDYFANVARGFRLRSVIMALFDFDSISHPMKHAHG